VVITPTSALPLKQKVKLGHELCEKKKIIIMLHLAVPNFWFLALLLSGEVKVRFLFIYLFFEESPFSITFHELWRV